MLWRCVLDESISRVTSAFAHPKDSRSIYPSDMPSSFNGMKIASSLVLPTVLSLRKRNLTSFCLLSSGTTGRPSITTNASKPSSNRTLYWSFRSVKNRYVSPMFTLRRRHPHLRSQAPRLHRTNHLLVDFRSLEPSLPILVVCGDNQYARKSLSLLR